VTGKGRLDRDYGQVANEVMCDTSLSINARALYALMATYADSAGFCYPGIPRLARELGASRRSVHRWVGELVEADILRRFDRTKDGRQTSSMSLLVERSRGVTSDTGGVSPVAHQEQDHKNKTSTGVHTMRRKS
jgi:hypothetical protein